MKDSVQTQDFVSLKYIKSTTADRTLHASFSSLPKDTRLQWHQLLKFSLVFCEKLYYGFFPFFLPDSYRTHHINTQLGLFSEGKRAKHWKSLCMWKGSSQYMTTLPRPNTFQLDSSSGPFLGYTVKSWELLPYRRIWEITCWNFLSHQLRSTRESVWPDLTIGLKENVCFCFWETNFFSPLIVHWTFYCRKLSLEIMFWFQPWGSGFGWDVWCIYKNPSHMYEEILMWF